MLCLFYKIIFSWYFPIEYMQILNFKKSYTTVHSSQSRVDSKPTPVLTTVWQHPCLLTTRSINYTPPHCQWRVNGRACVYMWTDFSWASSLECAVDRATGRFLSLSEQSADYSSSPLLTGVRAPTHADSKYLPSSASHGSHRTSWAIARTACRVVAECFYSRLKCD